MNKLLYICLLTAFFITCLPERDNPNDPKSRHNFSNRLSGRILTKVGNPLKAALITIRYKLNATTTSTVSNDTGNYVLDYLYSIAYGDSAIITASKSGFTDVQKVIEMTLNQNDTINFILDAIPYFDAESINSYHEAVIYPGDIYNLRLSVNVNDADGPGDIDSVFFVIPVFNVRTVMEYFPNNMYKLTISEDTFLDTTLENLIGNDCYFECLSKSGLRTRSNFIQLYRVIYENPQPIFPFGDTISQNFTCIWHKCNFSFPFSYGIEIYLLPINNIPQLVYQKSGIPSTDSIYTVPINFGRGRYLWQVLVRDNFGNISKSYKTLFYLE